MEMRKEVKRLKGVVMRHKEKLTSMEVQMHHDGDEPPCDAKAKSKRGVDVCDERERPGCVF